MYLSHFGLKESPFSLTPDTEYFFASTPHQEALNVLLVALANGEGFIKVTGEVGLGKTLICRTLLNRLGPEFVTAYIPNPHLSPGTLRASLADELEIKTVSRPTQEYLHRAITRRLIELAQDGKRVVLCMDEAQQLPDQTLETVRLLTNLETEKQKLLQVVLFGQPELDVRLAEQQFRQLRQRISFAYRIEPLDTATAAQYLRHRLEIAGHRGAPLLEPAAEQKLIQASRGIPRLLNILSHKAMLAAYGQGKHRISVAHIRAAIADTEDAGARRLPLQRIAAVLGVLALALGAGAWWLLRGGTI